MPPTLRRRARRSSERAPWPFWWGAIGIGIAGLVLIARAFSGSPTAAEASRPRPTPVAGVPSVPFATETALAESPSAPATPQITASPSSTPPQMATPISVRVASRFSPTALQPDADLAAQVVSILGGLSGHIGVAIKDLQTGRGVLIDPDGSFPAASVFKVEVMYEVFKQRELGALDFGESLIFTERHVSFDLGTLDRPAGASIRLDDALERMITISDNSSALLLTDRVGALNINRDLAGLGLSHTRLVEADLVTSPYDMLSFMEMLGRGQGISPEASQEMLQLLARQRINDRIPRLLPGGTTVAHKTGNLPGIVNDVGLVSSPDTTFAIAVFIADTPTEALAAQAISEIAATAYRYFGSVQPTLAPSPTVTPVPTATAPPTATGTPSPTPGPRTTGTTPAPTPAGSPVRTTTPTSR